MHRLIVTFVCVTALGAAAVPQVSAAGISGFAPASESARGPAADQVAAKRSCKAVSSCREAVQMWCDGYKRADADNDGIPCENICHSKKEVDAIRAEIGC
ncbi:hypothetical protein AB7M35_000157 [Amorphus suaedae]